MTYFPPVTYRTSYASATTSLCLIKSLCLSLTLEILRMIRMWAHCEALTCFCVVRDEARLGDSKARACIMYTATLMSYVFLG